MGPLRAIEVDGLVNARDLGGMVRADDSVTPFGVFFWSENVDWATSHGRAQLEGLGVRTIVDLRQLQERRRDVGERPGWVTTLDVDLDGLEHTEFWSEYWDNGLVGTALYFLPHLTRLPHKMAAVLDAIASTPKGGVLFHCMGGRDRTGLVSLVLLAAADVLDAEIVDDYLETVRLGGVRARTSKRDDAEPTLEPVCNARGTTTEGAFRHAVTGFDFSAWADAAELGSRTRLPITTWRGALEIEQSASGTSR